MKGFSIELVDRGRSRTLTVLFAVCACFFGGSVANAILARSQVAESQDTDQLRNVHSPNTSSNVGEQLQQVSKAMDASSLQYPWPQILESVEALAGTQTYVEHFEHDGRSGKTEVILVCNSFNDLREALERSRRQTKKQMRWQLQSVTIMDGQDPNRLRVNLSGDTELLFAAQR